MKQISSHSYEQVYKDLKINVDELGCIMLDIDAKSIPAYKMYDNQEDDFYFSKDPSKFWIKGFVAGVNPHITLLYGLLENGGKWKKHVDTVLKGWSLDEVKVKEVGFFPSHDPKEPYFCIIAHIEVTPELLEGHQRLSLLPHINTFTEYKPHMTLAYVKNDENIRDSYIDFYNGLLNGERLRVTGLNYGDKK